MTALILLNGLAGLLIGFRFRVYVLVPIVILFGVLVIGMFWNLAQDVWMITLSVAASTIAIQFGYLGGSVARCFFPTLFGTAVKHSPFLSGSAH